MYDKHLMRSTYSTNFFVMNIGHPIF